MENWNIQNERLVFGYIRCKLKIHVPVEIKQLCTLFYAMPFHILQFSAKYKSTHMRLSDSRRCINPKDAGHCYALCDIEPVKRGRRCWRFSTTNPDRGWILYGVSGKKKHKDSSYEVVFGMANCDQWFPYSSDQVDYQHHNDVSTWFLSRERHCEVDMRLDVKKRQIEWCLVGDADRRRPKLFKLPRTAHGWVPHINIHDVTTKIRMASIPTDLFGVLLEKAFL